MTASLTDLVTAREFFHGEYRLRKMWKEVDMAVYSANHEVLTRAVDTLVPKNSGADHTELLDLLLDYRLFETDSCGKYTISTDHVYDRIWNKLHGNSEWYNLLETLYADMCNDSGVEESLDYFFNLSINTGYYATHMILIPEKDFPVSGFDTDYLKVLTEPVFVSVKKFPVDVKGAIKTLSPSEFYLEYESRSSSAPVIPYWNAILVRTDTPFSISSAVAEIEKYIVQQVVEYKLLNNQPVSDEETALFLKYNVAMDGGTIKENGVRSRLIGLMMWDYVNVEGKTVSEAFYHMQDKGELYGYRPKKCGDVRFPYADCEMCPASKECFIYCCGLLDTATKSISTGLIQATGS